MPPLLALLASAAQVQAARDSSHQQQRRQVEGTELRPLRTHQQHWRRQQLMSTRRGWAAVAVAAALLAAAVAQPSVLAAPYLLAAVAAVWRWSGGRSGASGGISGRGMLQTYTAAYLMALYVWQAALHGWTLLQPAAKVLGLFSLSGDDLGWQQVLPAAVQLVALLLLYLALGAAGSSPGSSSSSSRSEEPRQWHGAASIDASGEHSEEQTPLLLSPRQQPQEVGGAPPPARRTASHHTVSPRQLLNLLLLDAAAVAWELLCSRPAAVAALLCITSLLLPSLLGGCLLLVALAALLLPPAARALQRLSRSLAAALLLWLLACYGATVAAAVTSIPAAAEAAGLRGFEGAAWLPLLAMLLSAAAAGGLARAGRRLSCGNLQLQDQLVPPRLQQLLDRLGSARMRTGGGSVSTVSSRPSSPTAAAGTSAAATWGGEAAAAPWQLAVHLLLRLLWYSGFLAVPLVLFVVGVQQYNVLHGIYLAGAPATWQISWLYACADGIDAANQPVFLHASTLLTRPLCCAAGLLTWLASKTLHLKPFIGAVSPASSENQLWRQGKNSRSGRCMLWSAAVCVLLSEPAWCVFPCCLLFAGRAATLWTLAPAHLRQPALAGSVCRICGRKPAWIQRHLAACTSEAAADCHRPVAPIGGCWHAASPGPATPGKLLYCPWCDDSLYSS